MPDADVLRIFLHRAATEIPAWKWALAAACLSIPLLVLLIRRRRGEGDPLTRFLIAIWLVTLAVAILAWGVVPGRFWPLVMAVGVCGAIAGISRLLRDRQ